MLTVSFQEFFYRAIPEGFLFMFAMYVFSKETINILRYIMSSVFYAVLVYLVRFLPIQAGVHTIINIFVVIILSVNINKIDIIKAIRSSIIAIIFEFICEAINVFIIQYIFKMDINYIFKIPKLKNLYGIPSLVIFGLCVALYYYIDLKKNKFEVH